MFRVCLIVALTNLPCARGQDVKDLRAQQIRLAEETYKTGFEQYLAGRGDVETVCKWSQRWFDAQSVDGTNAALLNEHVNRLRNVERAVQARFDAGKVTIIELNTVIYYRLGAQIQLEQTQAKKKKG